jgi:3-oxoacyl-[acyl-carrier protein] reductase
MVRACEKALRSAPNRGAVVNVSSIAGLTGLGSSIAYAASKGALNTMTKSLARALAPDIRVNAVCPGFIQSRWLRTGLGDERYEQLKSQVESTTPLQAASTPVEIAEPIVWLATAGAHVTGETITIDAGMHLGPNPIRR